VNIGILGGGQLGLMLGQAGIPLGMSFRIFEPVADAPAAKIGAHIRADYSDLSALEIFAAGLDLITYEFENVPVAAVEVVEKKCPVLPNNFALRIAQDRLKEKQLFQKLEIPTPDFLPATGRAEVENAVNILGPPVVIKTTRLGYDGKGQSVIREQFDLDKLERRFFAVPLIVEQFIPFERELSIITVRAKSGEQAYYPLVENIHRNGILRQSTAPAPHLTPALTAQAQGIANKIANELNYVGVFCVELFEKNEVLIANEIAPRVHNSGHWTIEGAECSQFENHIRAITGLPLGTCEPRGHSIMINIIGQHPQESEILALPNTHLHLYGKAARPHRKLGHITICGEKAETVANMASQPLFQSIMATS
jgi:5-(carboxyamino)imidazole ribonucleotide synthase